jgi:hypothetical protein
MEKTQNIAPY